MSVPRMEKGAALANLRKQLGRRVVTGREFLEVQEAREVWPAMGQAGLKESLKGMLLQGQITEIIDEGKGGGGLVLLSLLAEARRMQRYVVWIDVGCGFSPEGIPECDLESLLLVGCASVKEAVGALDTVSRDENFSLFLIDFRGSAPRDWKSIRESHWQRILVQLRRYDSAAVLFAKEPVTLAAKSRFQVDATLRCADLFEEREAVLSRLTVVRDAGWGAQNRSDVRGRASKAQSYMA